jgi:hypothetical protein
LRCVVSHASFRRRVAARTSLLPDGNWKLHFGDDRPDAMSFMNAVFTTEPLTVHAATTALNGGLGDGHASISTTKAAFDQRLWTSGGSPGDNESPFLGIVSRLQP